MIRKFFHTSSDFSTMQAQCSAQNGSFELATVTQEKFKFYQWFSGLVDGEGHFSIFSSSAAGASKGKTYGFSFAIGLHKDDKETLNFIVKELGMGKISFYANSARLVISDAKSIKSLIEIFTHFPLKSTKLLDFLAFKKAFLLYTQKKEKTLEILEEIKLIKEGMNSKRTDFDMSSIYNKDTIDININWLLGFIEGEGSFFALRRTPTNFSLVFSLTQLNSNKLLMEAIQEFFNNLAESLQAGIEGKSFNIGSWRDGKEGSFAYLHLENKSNKKDILTLHITRIEYLLSIFIPLFDSLSWHSKKYLDYLDWKALLHIRAKGLITNLKDLEVVDLILGQMNNKRLTTNRESEETVSVDRNLLLEKIENLLAKPSNFEVKEDGRIFIISENRYYSNKNKLQVTVERLDGTILHTFDSIKECLEKLNISKSLYYDRLNKGLPLDIEGELLYIKRSNKSVKTETIVLESSILLGIDFTGIFRRIFGSCCYCFLFPHITELNTYIKRAINSYIRKNNLYYFFTKWLSMGTINLLFLLCAKEYFSCDLSLLLNKKRFESNIYLTSSLKGYFSTYNRLSSIHSSIASINRVRYMATLRLSSIFSQQTLGYSTISQNQTQSISPWFISGYSDAEGCFNVGLQKNPNGKFYVRPSFQIHVHSKDNLLLMQIKAYFQNIGNIYISGEKSKFTVRSLDDILKIITHFENYPLITQKKADFILFKQIIDKVVKGEHLSAKGLQEIVNIRSSINMGISDSLKAIFPNTIPVIRPLIKTITIPHPEWMAGFVSGEGCFLVQMAKYGKGKLDGVSLSFKVSQHLRDELLLRSFISFFECGLFNYHSGKSESGSGVFIVRKFADISDKILPFFKNHVIRGIKREDFEDWARVAELIKSKAHLTEDGVKKTRAIKSGMNTLR